MSDASGGHPPPDRSLEHSSPARKRHEACVPRCSHDELRAADELGDELRRLKSFHEKELIDDEQYKASRHRALFKHGMLESDAPPAAPLAVAMVEEEEVHIFLKIAQGSRSIIPISQRTAVLSNSWDEVLQSASLSTAIDQVPEWLFVCFVITVFSISESTTDLSSPEGAQNCPQTRQPTTVGGLGYF